MKNNFDLSHGGSHSVLLIHRARNVLIRPAELHALFFCRSYLCPLLYMYSVAVYVEYLFSSTIKVERVIV